MQINFAFNVAHANNQRGLQKGGFQKMMQLQYFLAWRSS